MNKFVHVSPSICLKMIYFFYPYDVLGVYISERIMRTCFILQVLQVEYILKTCVYTSTYNYICIDIDRSIINMKVTACHV